MNKENSHKAEFHIHRFMYDLGIQKSDLIIYAALYSFTIGERGLFHGSRAYLAESVGVSEKTVYRSLAKLFSMGLVEKHTTEDNRYTGVRCVSLKEVENRKKEAKREVSEAEKEYKNELTKRVEERRSCEEKSKSSLEERCAESVEEHLRRVDELCARIDEKLHRAAAEKMLGRNAPEHEKNTFIMMQKYEKSGDNRKFLSFGKSGGVIMTEPQYKRLLDLLPTEELMPYFVKLENMLEDNLKTGKKPPHSHYKTLKKWIAEDLSL